MRRTCRCRRPQPRANIVEPEDCRSVQVSGAAIGRREQHAWVSTSRETTLLWTTITHREGNKFSTPANRIGTEGGRGKNVKSTSRSGGRHYRGPWAGLQPCTKPLLIVGDAFPKADTTATRPVLQPACSARSMGPATRYSSICDGDGDPHEMSILVVINPFSIKRYALNGTIVPSISKKERFGTCLSMPSAKCHLPRAATPSTRLTVNAPHPLMFNVQKWSSRHPGFIVRRGQNASNSSLPLSCPIYTAITTEYAALSGPGHPSCRGCSARVPV